MYDIGFIVDNLFSENLIGLGYEFREGQLDMACEIVDALRSRQHLVVEAGVGIGKSYAYLVPTVLYHVCTGAPVVIATSTIALQEQLIQDAHKVCKLLNVSPFILLAKGQTHYVCRKRMSDLLLIHGDKFTEDEKRVMRFAKERKDLPDDLVVRIWDEVCIEQYGRGCTPCHEKCKYYTIRRSLREENGIFICNQDFVTSHLMKIQQNPDDALINTDAHLIVLDEAHNLEDRVRNATTYRLDESNILMLLKNALKELSDSAKSEARKAVQRASHKVESFFETIRQQAIAEIRKGQRYDSETARIFFSEDTSSIAKLDAMCDSIVNANMKLQIGLNLGYRKRSTRASDELDTISEALSTFRKKRSNYIKWIERCGNRFEFVFCPNNTSETIADLYFSGATHTIMTSATLANTNSGLPEQQYSYLISNNGIPLKKTILAEPKASPFPYDRNAMIYYASDLPHPTVQRDAFLERATERLIELLNVTDGRALILFTAKTDLDYVYLSLKKKRLPYKVLRQAKGSSQDAVLSEFRENERSVLLGTGAYWEGINIAGKSLSQVVIFRLPFPVPDPIIEYKMNKAQENPMMEVSVPEMIIKLKQGIGRLIRSDTDTGIVSILDPRLREGANEYADIVWDSLPIKNKSSVISDVNLFYKNLIEDQPA